MIEFLPEFDLKVVGTAPFLWYVKGLRLVDFR